MKRKLAIILVLSAAIVIAVSFFLMNKKENVGNSVAQVHSNPSKDTPALASGRTLKDNITNSPAVSEPCRPIGNSGLARTSDINVPGIANNDPNGPKILTPEQMEAKYRASLPKVKKTKQLRNTPRLPQYQLDKDPGLSYNVTDKKVEATK